MKYRNAYITEEGQLKLSQSYDRIYKALDGRSRVRNWLGVFRFEKGRAPQRMTIVDYVVEWWND